MKWIAEIRPYSNNTIYYALINFLDNNIVAESKLCTTSTDTLFSPTTEDTQPCRHNWNYAALALDDFPDSLDSYETRVCLECMRVLSIEKIDDDDEEWYDDYEEENYEDDEKEEEEKPH